MFDGVNRSDSMALRRDLLSRFNEGRAHDLRAEICPIALVLAGSASQVRVSRWTAPRHQFSSNSADLSAVPSQGVGQQGGWRVVNDFLTKSWKWAIQDSNL